MSALSVHDFEDLTVEEAGFGPAAPIRRIPSTGLVGLSLASFAPRYAALMRDLCRARSNAAKRCDWVRFRELGDEVAMLGAVIAHQTQLREAVAA